MTWLAVTLLAFAFGLLVQGRARSPLANPTLIACLILVPLLLLSHTAYASYSAGTRPLSLLLTPAVVALAVPLYRQRLLIRRAWRAVLLGGVVGTLIAVGVNSLGGRLIQAPREVRLALSTDSVTSPVAYAISERLNGAPPLAAAFVIIVGLIGAIVLPGLLKRLGVTSRMARGIALGAVAHGIGTARAREDGDLSGAAASVGMCLGALMVTLVSAGL
ncbi:LrgB family protein [Deinococcus radiomollis]|uniref:LrgB family protein n=1 Tax=Deinococcus radiomollis TaxID=468916 RepID=UPI003891B6E0